MLPREPLERLLTIDGELPTAQEIHRMFRITPKRWRRWGREGLTEPEADRVACRVLGMHPHSVWGEAWFDRRRRRRVSAAA